MQTEDLGHHVYERTIFDLENDSLALLARLIPAGAVILDLGMGAGELGRYLTTRQTVTLDGLTISRDEAQIALDTYRCIEVADLDSFDLCAVFQAHTYDYIVCADVLEHLKAPERVLQQCRRLLKPGGHLLTSVPNIAYCGLIAELFHGEFEYRTEGLLDKTHLRFFTRKSLYRFFANQGWQINTCQTTSRNVLSSEFKAQFNHLPPAVARYLLSLPDASTYQFICSLQPTSEPYSVLQSSPQAQPLPLFSAQLYFEVDGQYSESNKSITAGTMGNGIQTLNFNVPAQQNGHYTQIRLDPADRPGFMRLLSVRLISKKCSTPIWSWQAETESRPALERSPQNQISWSPTWGPTNQSWLQLLGDDPWIELPLSSTTLEALSQSGGELQMVCSWPMSADYLQANQQMQSLVQTHLSALQELKDELASCIQAQTALHLQLQHANHKTTDLLHQLEQSSQDKLKSHAQLSEANDQLHAIREQLQNSLAYIVRIENSKLFTITRPLVRLKYWLYGHLGLHPTISPTQHHGVSLPQPNNEAILPLPLTPVDVIVPVYRGLSDTMRSIESALASTCKSLWHLVIINDCSPEPEVTQWLRNLAAQDSRVTLLENTNNLGFVATVNRGMRLHPDRDVLLLNSDTEVANDWLDRLQRAAYAHPNVASVTPFSNNATICSYPRFCEANDLPAGHTTASLDRLFSHHLAGRSVEVPTGVGFCMYIRRATLKAIGDFDEEHFGKGYGEENDFCIRAKNAGWINLHLLDTFVRHVGGISFGDTKSERELNAMRTLKKLHPSYDEDVQRYIVNDPAQCARRVIDLARITDSGKPVILNITHNREGGTLRHVQEMGQYLAQWATFLRLTPAPRGVTLQLESKQDNLRLFFALPKEEAQLVQTLQQLQVGHVHFHHLLGHTEFVDQLPQLLRVQYDFTVHDYYGYCPQISLTNEAHRYCGEKGLDQCRQCLQHNPAPGGLSIENWRKRYTPLFEKARTVICPSADTAQRIFRFVPQAKLQILPHSRLQLDEPQLLEPIVHAITPEQSLKIVVIGGLSQIKGADVVEDLACLAAQQNLRLEIHLLGFAYRQLKTHPNAHLTVHGAYDDQDLPHLLDQIEAHVAWFPALWPETYSYTLSTCLEKGLPIVAPSLGAFHERLANRSWSWIAAWDQSAISWSQFFLMIRKDHFLVGHGPNPVEAPQSEIPSDGSFDYHHSYLQGLAEPVPQHADKIAQFALNICNRPSQSSNAITASKSHSLRFIQLIKGRSIFAPLVKALPLHFQRRVKSWLLQ